MERDAPKREGSGLHPCHSDLLCDAVRLPHGTIASLLLQSIGDAIGNADHRRSIPHAGEVHDATRHSHEVHGATRHVHGFLFPSRVWAIMVATAIPAAALVALYHLLVLLALGLLLVPI